MNKTLGLAGLAVAAVFSSSIAYSATYMVGPLGEMPYDNDVHVKKGVTFSDIYNFDVAPGVGDAALNSVNNPLILTLPKKTQTIFDIPDLTMSVFSGYGGTGSTVALMTSSFSGMLSAGSYSAVVTGTPTGTAGGKYSFIAAAVPEAQTWAMIGVGLGLVVLQLRRRDKSAVKLATA